MTTKLEITKGGIRLLSEVSTHPRPRPRQAWPVPNFPDAGGSALITAALESVDQTGRKGIRISSIGAVLPGGPTAVWTLLHAAYQGSAPDPLAWEEIPVSAPKIYLLITDPLPAATHRFKLRRVEAEQTTGYPEISIATPDDAAWQALDAILQDDVLSRGEKPSFKLIYDDALADQTQLDAHATQWSITTEKTTYDAACTALISAVTALSPAYTDLTQDTPLGSGGGASLRTKFANVYNSRAALWKAIADKVKGTLDDIYSDDKLTPPEKRIVKSQYDGIHAEQTTATTGLDALADAASVSRTAYDTAISALETALDALNDPGPVDAWNGSTKDWIDYTKICDLGSGGGATLRGLFATVRIETIKLRGAIEVASLAPGKPTDVFRPALMWDLGDTSDAGFTYSGGSAADSPSPYAKVGRTLTWSSGSLMALSPDFTSSALTGKQARVVIARVRLNSGTWVGKVHFKGASPSITVTSTNKWSQVQAPTVGVWTDVAWDMANLTVASTDYISNTNIQQIQLELLSSAGSVEVDWVAVGTYGAGSLADYNLAVAYTATNAMLNATYLVSGKFNGALIAVDSVFSKQVVVANFDNLAINPNSEMDTTNAPTGALESMGVSTDQAYGGTRSRKILGGGAATYTAAPVTMTRKLSVTPGEVYYCTAQALLASGGLGGDYKIRARYYDGAGSALSVVDVITKTPTVTYGWEEMFGMWTVPASAMFMEVELSSYGVNVGVLGIYFDSIYIRHAMDGRVIVDGSILAQHIFAGQIQTYHISVGPNYQFKSSASGQPLMLNNDGTFAANTVGTENVQDKAVYMDDARIYPAARAKTYEANFSGAGDRGFMVNMSSNAFATSGTQGGLRILHSGTSITVQGVNYLGSAGYGSALTPTTTPNSVTTAGTGKLTAVFSGATGTSEARRLIIKLDGVEVQTYSDSALGSSFNGQRSGYAGIILGTHGTRPGDVRAWGIGMGIGFVTLQDGVVTAEALVADLAIVNTIRSANYLIGSTSASATGFKVSGTAWNVVLKGDSSPTSVQAEFGDNVAIAGYKAQTLADRIMLSANSATVLTNSVTVAGTSTKMCGLGISFTPGVTGKALVIMSGTLNNNTAGQGVQYSARYGTGTAPSSGAAQTGTIVGGGKRIDSMTADQDVGFTVVAILTGLTVGTVYWFDLSMNATSAGSTARLFDGVHFAAMEIG